MNRFSRFYERNYSLILAVAGNRLDSHEAAEDVASAAFAITWEKYQSGAPLRVPTLYGIVRNLIGNEYQRLARRQRLESRIYDDAIAQRSEEQRRRPNIDAALSRLTPEHREILELFYWDELTTAEAGKVLGCRAGTARVRLHRARGALTQLLDDHPAELEEVNW